MVGCLVWIDIAVDIDDVLERGDTESAWREARRREERS